MHPGIAVLVLCASLVAVPACKEWICISQPEAEGCYNFVVKSAQLSKPCGGTITAQIHGQGFAEALSSTQSGATLRLEQPGNRSCALSNWHVDQNDSLTVQVSASDLKDCSEGPVNLVAEAGAQRFGQALPPISWSANISSHLLLSTNSQPVWASINPSGVMALVYNLMPAGLELLQYSLTGNQLLSPQSWNSLPTSAQAAQTSDFVVRYVGEVQGTSLQKTLLRQASAADASETSMYSATELAAPPGKLAASQHSNLFLLATTANGLHAFDAMTEHEVQILDFSAGTSIGSGQIAAMAVGDLDGDNQPEAVLVLRDTMHPQHLVVLHSDTDGLRWSQSGSDGISQTLSGVLQQGIGALSIADLDEDGRSELLLMADDGGTLWSLTSPWDPALRALHSLTLNAPPNAPPVIGLSVGDVNSDHHPDLLVTGGEVQSSTIRNGALWLYLNQSQCSP